MTDEMMHTRSEATDVTQQPCEGEAPANIQPGVTVITAPLPEGTVIQLESSNVITPGHVPVVVATAGEGYPTLSEGDAATFLLPVDFGRGYAVMLSDTADEVIIDAEVYDILYHGLDGAENPGPTHYTVRDLLLGLEPLADWGTVHFAGWVTAGGDPVDTIPAGTTGFLELYAAWRGIERQIIFRGNGTQVEHMPANLTGLPGDPVVLGHTVPRRAGYTCLGWQIVKGIEPPGFRFREPPPGPIIPPGGTLIMPDGDIVLYAAWQRR